MSAGGEVGWLDKATALHSLTLGGSQTGSREVSEKCCCSVVGLGLGPVRNGSPQQIFGFILVPMKINESIG